MSSTKNSQNKDNHVIAPSSFLSHRYTYKTKKSRQNTNQMKKGKMFPNILTAHPQDLLVCYCLTPATANESVAPYFSF